MVINCRENHNTRGIPRPVLLLHFKIPSPALAKIAKKKSLPVPGKTIIKHEEIKQKEKPIVNKKIKVTENTASRKFIYYFFLHKMKELFIFSSPS